MAAPAHDVTRTTKESHWVPEQYGRITELCEAAVGDTPGIRSVSHFSNGILDFTVHRPDRAPLSSLVAEPGRDAQDEALPGSRLLLCAQDLGSLLHPLGTGDLMRTVVANGHGGLWGGRVKPGEYLAAVADDGRDVPAMDAAMNTLVTRIRTSVHKLPDEMPGGNDDAAPGAPDHSERLRVDFGTAAEQDDAYEQRLRSLWGRHLGVAELQYAAYYKDLTLVCVGDVFEDPELGPRFMDVSVQTRRTAYRELARSLRRHVVRLTDVLSLVGQPSQGQRAMDRLILDVQEGAVYVTWPSPREFVIGVTLDQTQVANAEARLDQLTSCLGEFREPPPR